MPHGSSNLQELADSCQLNCNIIELYPVLFTEEYYGTATALNCELESLLSCDMLYIPGISIFKRNL